MSKMLFKEHEVNSRKKILKIIKDPKMGSVVNNIKEKREVISQLKRYSPGGVTKDEARKILGKFYYDKKDSLNGAETAALAKAFGISGAHKYAKLNNGSRNIKTKYSHEKESGFSNNFTLGSKSNNKFGRIRSLH